MFKFKTEPRDYQLTTLERSADREYYAYLLEPGLGKTKITIDNSAYLYDEKKIDAVFVAAPGGVHENWVLDEIPIHLPDHIDYKAMVWNSKKAKNKSFEEEFLDLLKHDGLVFFCMNYEAVITKEGAKRIAQFLETRKVLFVCDESHRIKSMSARRTKAILKAGKLALYRRILTGTPVGNSPFDVYTQFFFLCPKILGFSSFHSFKNRFGVFKKQFGNGRHFQQLVRYRNIEKLHELIDPHATRLTKDDCLNLPDKIYQKRYVELSPAQKKHYVMLKEMLWTQLANGEIVSAPLAITNLLRLQQVVCGHLPTGEDGETVEIDDTCPRINALLEVLEDTPGKVIVWARFRADIKHISEALERANISCVTYYGDTTAEERLEARRAFQDGDVRVFLANPATAGEGLTLHAASTVVYYNNSFKLTERIQSEDRAHRIGQKKSVTYIDLVTKDTVDERVVQALRDKQDLAAQITGDTLKEWL